MRVQVLVATMNQNDFNLVDKMNIQTDAIIGNQCDHDSVELLNKNDKKICYINMNGVGVGLNRNMSLLRATADICLFADDDMVYEEDYEKLIIESFEKNPKADVIIINLKEKVPKRYVIKKTQKIGWFNYLRYGTARIAVRLQSIRDNGIFFNLCFGGGTEHSHGEDNLFLTDCLKKKLRIVAVPEYVASLTEERESTWLKGYDKKYFRDQGCLYRTISRRWWKLLCFQDALRHRKTYNMSPCKSYRLMTRKKTNK